MITYVFVQKQAFLQKKKKVFARERNGLSSCKVIRKLAFQDIFFYSIFVGPICTNISPP